jgi:hypothetical protein
MARKPNPYKRLPGNGSQLMIPAPYIYLIALICPLVLFLRSRVRLWQASDHVLNVTYSNYTEQYKRFYFNEIQSITLRRTKEGMIWNLVFGTLTAIFGFGWAVSGELAAQIIFGILTGVFGTALLANAILGPTCVCHVKTAVHNEPLFSLNRVRPALKAIGRIQTQIAAAQPRPATAEQVPCPSGSASGSEPAPEPEPGTVGNVSPT